MSRKDINHFTLYNFFIYSLSLSGNSGHNPDDVAAILPSTYMCMC